MEAQGEHEEQEHFLNEEGRDDELFADKLSVYDPKEFCAEIDGWELYKKSKFNI